PPGRAPLTTVWSRDWAASLTSARAVKVGGPAAPSGTSTVGSTRALRPAGSERDDFQHGCRGRADLGGRCGCNLSPLESQPMSAYAHHRRHQQCLFRAGSPGTLPAGLVAGGGGRAAPAPSAHLATLCDHTALIGRSAGCSECW